MGKVIELKLDSNGNLHLTKGGNVDRGTIFGRKVSWEIKDRRIESFKIEGKPENNGYYPFTEPLKENQSTYQELKVSTDADRGEWKYSIIWVDTATHLPHPYDPKIAVKPVMPFTEPISFFILAIIGITGVLFYRYRKIRNRKAR